MKVAAWNIVLAVGALCAVGMIIFARLAGHRAASVPTPARPAYAAPEHPVASTVAPGRPFPFLPPEPRPHLPPLPAPIDRGQLIVGMAERMDDAYAELATGARLEALRAARAAAQAAIADLPDDLTEAEERRRIDAIVDALGRVEESLLSPDEVLQLRYRFVQALDAELHAAERAP